MKVRNIVSPSLLKGLLLFILKKVGIFNWDNSVIEEVIGLN